MGSSTIQPCICGCGADGHFGPPTNKGPCRKCFDCRFFQALGYIRRERSAYRAGRDRPPR